MLLYFILVIIIMALAILPAVIISITTHTINLLFAFLAPFAVNLYVLLVMGVVALLLRIIIPISKWNFCSKFFTVKDSEITFYNKIKIRKWKDKIPEMGCAAGFRKDHINSTKKEYIERFLQETCYAEVMHLLSGILGFTALLFYNPRYYYFVLVITVGNLFLHLLPCFVQRFTRYRLIKVYNRKYQVEN